MQAKSYHEMFQQAVDMRHASGLFLSSGKGTTRT
jgi:hypothetical protein